MTTFTIINNIAQIKNSIEYGPYHLDRLWRLPILILGGNICNPIFLLNTGTRSGKRGRTPNMGSSNHPSTWNDKTRKTQATLLTLHIRKGNQFSGIWICQQLGYQKYSLVTDHHSRTNYKGVTSRNWLLKWIDESKKRYNMYQQILVLPNWISMESRRVFICPNGKSLIEDTLKINRLHGL